MKHDIKKLENGDETMVGERGVALSGGQKARVNLARAVYREADIYLLDDPLSAVDSHVGRHLFDKCIKDFLKDKVVILVTHQLQYLKEADNILVLNKGSVIHQGDFPAIIKSGADISSFMSEDKEEEEANDDIDIEKPEKEIIDTSDEEKEKKHEELDEVEQSLLPQTKAKDEHEELTKEGNINKRVYIDYIKSGANLCTGFVLTVATISTHGCYVLSDLWIRKWTNDEEQQIQQYEEHLFNDTIDVLDFNDTFGSLAKNYSDQLNAEFEHMSESNKFNLAIYAALVLGLVVACAIQTVQYYVCCMTASRTLHNRMFEKILRAPTHFYDVNPTGRILNRFSKDMGSMDEQLPMTMLDVKWVNVLVRFCDKDVIVNTFF